MSSQASQTTLPYAPPAERASAELLGVSLRTWVMVLATAGLFSWLYWSSLVRLWLKTNPFFGESNWQHSILVPIIGLYYLYLHRDELRRLPVKPAWSGALILVLGILLFGYGIHPGRNDFVKDVGMVVSLFGLVALLCGWRVMSIAWFPIVFLFCALPWPGLVYSYIAGPLQELAARVAVVVLKATGVTAIHYGTKITMLGEGNAERTLNVAEACAGLRSLMTFVSLGAAVAFLSSRPLWQKVFITLSTVPIAIFCNVMRVSGQGLLDYYVSHKFSQDFAHQFVGLVMLIPAFFLILLVGWILDQLFVEESDEHSVRHIAPRPAMAGAGGASLSSAAAATVAPSQPASPASAVNALPNRAAPAKAATPTPLPATGGLASVKPPPAVPRRRGFVPPPMPKPPAGGPNP